MDALATAYPASTPTPTAPVEAAPPRPPVKPASDGPDSAAQRRARVDSASFSQEALRRLAQEHQAKQGPSADGTSGV